MNILLLGSGGREHALARQLVMSPDCSRLFIAPGNSGTALCGTNTDLSLKDFESIGSFCLKEDIKMLVVGPEEPLVNGIADFFENNNILKHIAVIGPSAHGARLEGSKDFSKAFMHKFGIPTASYRSFGKDELEAGIAFLHTLKPPYVLKADGLAAGKGVLICQTIDEAGKELKAMLLDNKFGSAGEKVVIEEFLAGIELSLFVLTDGESYKILPSAKDYKRIGENDSGLNTGGMGAVSPVPFADEAFLKKVEQSIVIPTTLGLKIEDIPYKGFIFIGLMNVDGEPFVIEYNVRLGDPETEVVIPRIKNDLVQLFTAVAGKTLKDIEIETDPRTAATVVLVAGGYPGDYKKGDVITGLESVEDSLVFHAGSSMKDGRLQTNGGRVMAITSFGDSVQQAVGRSLESAAKIQYADKYYRKDIGRDLMHFHSNIS
jgi:phosphoribosylamine--glycine ligase